MYDAKCITQSITRFITPIHIHIFTKKEDMHCKHAQLGITTFNTQYKCANHLIVQILSIIRRKNNNSG